MNQTNLLPKSRIAAKRRASSIRRWVMIDSICAGVLLVATVAVLAAQPGTNAAVFGNDGTLATTTALHSRLSTEVAAVNVRLESLRDLSATPDWGRLLATLSRQTGDDVVLDSVTCRIVAGKTDSAPRGVRISGTGQSQQAVAEFVLRLEHLKFFGGVTLTQTSSKSIAGADGVGFEVFCTLPEASRPPTEGK